MPQQSSPSSTDEESQWVAVEDRRRRRVAFEKTAKRMLRYLEDSEDLKVSVTELEEQLRMSEEASISIEQVAQQARNEEGQHLFWSFFARRRRGMHCHSWPDGTPKRSGGEGKKSQNVRQEGNLLSERQEIFRGMVEDKIRMQSRATEKYYEQIFYKMKELEEKKYEDGLLLVQKKYDL